MNNKKTIKELIESKKHSPSVSFKILIKDTKNVVVNGDFEKYNTFTKLREKIIENLKTPFFKQNNLNINYNKKFKLVYICDKEKNLDFPDELGGEVWDDRTYELLKNKSKGLKDIKYKFYIENYDISEVLDKALDKYWDKAFNNITDELHLLELEKSNNKYNNKDNDNGQNKINQEHTNIICSNCFKNNFTGNRYMCAECNNYNLCQNCEKSLIEKEIHDREHTFIQIKGPIQKDDYFEYNNIIGNYIKEINNITSNGNYYDLKITVINNGEKDLKDCYILPVRYGDEYLFCDSKKIRDSVTPGKSYDTQLKLKIPKIKKGIYKGYFRMFTPQKLPFGDVVFVKFSYN